jgi:hypothetical protein
MIKRGLRRLGAKIWSTTFLLEMMEIKFAKAKTFTYNDIELNYFYHSYNNHRLTDRSVEIPIIRHYWNKSFRILEIGNVTNHYYTYFSKTPNFLDKTVVDKYEKAAGVYNKDIIEYNTNLQFDFIYSISTFEHITNCLDAIKHVYNKLLIINGRLIITAPMEYSKAFDDIILYRDLSILLPDSKVTTYIFKRINEIKWKQLVTKMTFKSGINYDSKFKGTKYLIILEISKKASYKENGL